MMQKNSKTFFVAASFVLAFGLSIVSLSVLNACGSASDTTSTEARTVWVDEATARATSVSVITVGLQGGFVPIPCDANVDLFQPVDPNLTYCTEGWVQGIDPNGVVQRNHGCYTKAPATLEDSVTYDCRPVSREQTPLSPNDWLVAKQKILSSHPLQIESVDCQSPNVQCPSDYDSPSVTLIIDANSHRFSWPSGAGNLPVDLQTVIDTLTGLQFFL